jgi:hypothetical protein
VRQKCVHLDRYQAQALSALVFLYRHVLDDPRASLYTRRVSDVAQNHSRVAPPEPLKVDRVLERAASKQLPCWTSEVIAALTILFTAAQLGRCSRRQPLPRESQVHYSSARGCRG